MFHEEFNLDNDEYSASYDPDELKIKYFMQSIYSPEEFIQCDVHEWIHGLIDWATEGVYKPTEKQDHWMIRFLGWNCDLGWDRVDI